MGVWRFQLEAISKKSNHPIRRDTMHFEGFWKLSHIKEGGGRGAWLTLSNNDSIENNRNVEVWYNGTVSFRTPERTTSVILSHTPHHINGASPNFPSQGDGWFRHPSTRCPVEVTWVGKAPESAHFKRSSLAGCFIGVKDHPVVAKVDSMLILDHFWDCILKQLVW